MTKEYYDRSVIWLRKLEAGTILRIELFRLGLHWYCDNFDYPIIDPEKVILMLIWYADTNCDPIAYYNQGVLFQEGIIRKQNLAIAKWCFMKAQKEGMNVARELEILNDLKTWNNNT